MAGAHVPLKMSSMLVGNLPSTANIGIGECVQPILMWPTNMATLCPVFYLGCGNLDNWFDQAASKVYTSLHCLFIDLNPDYECSEALLAVFGGTDMVAI